MHKKLLFLLLFFQGIQASEAALLAALEINTVAGIFGEQDTAVRQNPARALKKDIKDVYVVLPVKLDAPSDKLLQRGDAKETHSLESVRESDESSAEGSLVSVEEDVVGAGALTSEKEVVEVPHRKLTLNAQAIQAAAEEALQQKPAEEKIDVLSQISDRMNGWKQSFLHWWDSKSKLDRYQVSLQSMSSEVLKSQLAELTKKSETTLKKQVLRIKAITQYAGPEFLNLGINVLSLDSIALETVLDRKMQEYELEYVDSAEAIMSKRIIIFELERLVELFNQSAEHLDTLEYKIECIEKELETRPVHVKMKKRRAAIL